MTGRCCATWNLIRRGAVHRGNSNGIFITGTDTAVGKTVFSAALARLLKNRGINIGVMKPVTSGCTEINGHLVSDDAELLAWGAGIKVTADVAPYLLKEPVAPSVAAEIDHVKIEFSRILAAYHKLCDEYEYVIVEGAGGLMVPLAGGLMVADLVKLLSLPLLVVARPNLGTVNHTVLTCFVARELGLEVKGTIINNFPASPDRAESTAPHLIDSLSGVPLLSRLPSFPGIDNESRVEKLAEWLANEPATRILLREIGFE